MDTLYREKILDHYHHPRNYGLRDGFDIEAKGNNMVCGDSIVIRLKFSGEVVCDICFESDGCVLSRAGASMISNYIKGKTLDEVRALGGDDMMRLLGVTPTPARLKCATLALDTLRAYLK